MSVYNAAGRWTAQSGRVVDVSSNEIPEHWADRMVAKGFTDPRYRQDVPSMSALASKTGLHTSTISATIKGLREPTAETINALVAELGEDVAGWLGVPYHGEWKPPAASTLLTPRQRKALDELIVSMTVKELMGNAEHPAATSKPAPSPAQQLGRNDFTAVASGGGTPEEAAEADRLAALAKAKQQEAIEEMERKKREREEREGRPDGTSFPEGSE